MLKFVGIDVPRIFHNKYLSMGLALFVMLSLGYNFYYKSLKGLRNLYFGMDFLISFGSLISFLYSLFLLIFYRDRNEVLFFDSAALIVYFAYLGKSIETRLKNKSMNSLKEFESSIPSKYFMNNKWYNVLDLKIGDIITVKANAVIPADGIILSKKALIEESIITGENNIKTKKQGDYVYCSSVNHGNEIDVLAQVEGKNSLINKIIKYIKKSELQKTKIQSVADKFIPYFTLSILFIAILVFILWSTFNFAPIYNYNINSNRWDKAFRSSISVIVISCPCALGLAGPLAILVGVSKSAKRGIVFNSAKTFDKLSKCDIVFLDKTGTLTTQEIKILKIDGQISNQTKQILIEMTFNSEHPISKTIFNFLNEKSNFKYTKKEEVKNVIGSGLFYENNNNIYKLGKSSFALNIALESKEDKIYFTRNGNFVCSFIIDRPLRNDALNFVNKIRDMKSLPILITGDTYNNSLKIAQYLKIDNIYTDIDPKKKQEIVNKYKNNNKTTCFIGDGINDAMAMKESDLSISIGSSSKLAVSSSDINIMSDQLTDVFEAIKIKDTIKRKIYSNYFWAASYNIVAIPIAAIGILLPWMAAAFMMFSEVIIVINSLLLRIKNKK